MSTAPSLISPLIKATGLGDNAMHPLAWIPAATVSLLDIGCNDGALLADCRQHYPDMRLCGMDVNQAAIAKAQAAVPGAQLRCVQGVEIPFESESLDCVTCIEVIEHVPASQRASLIGEVRRVLKPGGIFILRCPHAGAFAWLDSNNLRFRLPAVYKLVVRGGLRDKGYVNGADGICWHQHFTLQELDGLTERGFTRLQLRFGGLLLFPLVDILRWPFYRLKKYEDPLLKLLDRVASWDLGMDYGVHSFDVLTILTKVDGPRTD